MVRIAIGGLLHETSTFSRVPTTLGDFMRTHLAGAEILERRTGTKSALGGFIDAARHFAFEAVPTFWAATAPGGVVTAEALRTLTDTLVAGIQRAQAQGGLDGVLLDLHGAMVAETDADAESYTLRAVREVVGPELPVIVELDLHGNITPAMVQLATVCVAYDEYPHVDPYERGYECGGLMMQIVRGGVKPTSAIVNIPLLSDLTRQYTYGEPMLSVKHLVHDIEAERGILNVSYLPGFPFADIPHTNFAVIVTTDNNPAQARTAAAKLAAYIWERRSQFVAQHTPVDEAITAAMAEPRGPVILADLGDNPGAGTPADGTVMLEALLRLGAKQAVVAPINDPEAAQLAHNAGVGATLNLALGGKTDPFHGAPLSVTAKVVNLTDGDYVHTGPMGTGVLSNMGRCAVLEIAGRNGGAVQVLVTTYRHQPLDLNMLQSQGIEPTAQHIIVVKSLVHYRAAFMPIASRIIEVDTPGLSNPDVRRLDFKQVQRPMYPLDVDMEWTPAAV
jgi:microcystin degradation protein MlrC